MDVITETLRREVALDCYQGTPLERVWAYVEMAQRELAEKNGLGADSVNVDDSFKSYIWPFILQMKSMVFFQDETVIYSASEMQQTTDKNFPQLTLTQAQQKYPRLSMRGTEAAINTELFGRVQGNRRILASEKAFLTLQLLARARAEGMTQVDLKNTLNVDARSMFHFIKILDLEGLVSKMAAFTNNGHTNLVLLRRFAQKEPEEEPAQGSVTNNDPDQQNTAIDKFEFLTSMVRKGLRKRISDILQQAETGVMVESDVIDAVKLDWCNLRERKYFHRVTRDLWESGCIEVLRLQVKDPEGPSSATTASSAVVLSNEETNQDQAQDHEENEDGDRSGDDEEIEEGADADAEADEEEDNGNGDNDNENKDTAESVEKTMVKKEKMSSSESILEKKKRKREQTMEKNKRRKRELKRIRDRLREGYSFRRCLRFIKPYVPKRKERGRLGIPMQEQSAANQNHSRADNDEACHNTTVIDADLDAEDDIDGDGDVDVDDDIDGDGDVDVDVEDDAIYDEDSDANVDSVDVEAIKEKEDVRYLLSKDEVHIGLSNIMPLETQIFRLIALSGRSGTVTKALQFILRENSHKLIARVLARLEKTPFVDAQSMLPGVLMDPIVNADKEYLITSVEEFVGREHRRRYFANPRAQAAIAALTSKHDVAPDSSVGAIEDTVAIVDRAVAQIQAQTQEIAGNALAPMFIDHSRRNTKENSGLDATSETRMDIDSIAENKDDISNKLSSESTAHINVNANDSANGSGNHHSHNHGNRNSEDTNEDANANAQTDMQISSYGQISDIVREAHERKMAINGVIRERVILDILERDKMFACDISMLSRLEKEVREFVLTNRNASEVTQSMVDSALKYTMDKRTLLRTVKAMAAQEKVWLHVLTSLPPTKALNKSRVESIVIARDVDPHGPLVDAFIAELCDRRYLRPMTSMIMPRKVSDEISVTRTEGAAQRDARYMVYAQNLLVARVVNNIGGHERWRRINRCENVANDSPWEPIAKRLYKVPLRIARICDLHAFLASALPTSVDGVTVFDNCSFRSSYFFSHLTLELYLRLCGGLSHLPFLHRYIRYGVLSSDLDSDDEGDDDSLTTSRVEEIEERLATPISKLPKTLHAAITTYVTRSRALIQPFVNALHYLRLLRPINTVAEVVSVDSHSDSRDSVAIPENSRVLSLGYQLVRYARVMSRESVVAKAAIPKFEDDRVFDILSAGGVGLYWDAVEKLHRNAEPKLPSSHPLGGIDHYRYWTRRLILSPLQIDCLKGFVNEEKKTTPLDDLDDLKQAAEAAGISIELARQYYRNALGKMTKVEIRRRNVHRRNLFIRERIRAAKEKAIAEGRLPAEKVKPQREVKRRPWTESESNLIALAYAVLRHHAHSHRHPFLLHNLAKLFPSRSHTVNPNEGVRGRWARLRRDQAYASMADTLYVVWKYVLRDAVESEALLDEPDLTDFDLQAATNYYRDILNQTSLEVLVERYADEINEDIEGGTEALLAGKWRLTRVVVDKRKAPRRPPRTRSSKKPTGSSSSGGQRGPRMPFTYRYRLPKTMVGHENRYLIASYTEPRGRGIRAYIDDDYPEDTYLEGISTKSHRQLAYTGMLVAHDSNSDLGDHFSQVTTLLNGSQLSRPDAIAQAAKSSVYPDCMSTLSPVQRTVDLDILVGKVNSLIIGNDAMEQVEDSIPVANDDTEVPDDQIVVVDSQSESQQPSTTSTASVASVVDPAEQYAHVAAMQAMLINLTLTPESEYQVTSGHNLLSTDEKSASTALQELSHNSVISRLTSMATTTGIGNNNNTNCNNNGDGDGKESSSDKDLDASATTGKSTVVVHETTGVLRVVLNDAPRIGQNSDGFDFNYTTAAQERNVPGRGISISEKFLLAISSTLPQGFTKKTVFDPSSATV
ncbi:hypothetical protein FB639_000463, partial [Coemansia asiatica]